MHHQNLEQLKALRLFGMARALEELAHTRERDALTFDDQLAVLIEREAADRANLALTHRLRRAHLRQNACLENLDLRTPRGLDRALVRDLASCRWVSEHRPILVIGPTGVGKTWIVCALGNQAARESHVVLYTRLNRLLDDLAVARLEGGANRLLRKLARVAVLILDDFAMTELTASQRRDLMEVIDDRHERGATVIATQVPVERWHHQIGDPTYADAILDRLVHQAYRIDLKGESLRKTRAGGESLSAASSGAAE
jgi:DNA replication protein DnaC